METEILLRQIEELANIMIKEPPFGIPDKISRFINETDANIEFVLFIARDGLSLYRKDEKQQAENLLYAIFVHNKKGIDYLIYEYDLSDLWPHLSDDVTAWASEKFGL